MRIYAKNLCGIYGEQHGLERHESHRGKNEFRAFPHTILSSMRFLPFGWKTTTDSRIQRISPS